MKKEKLVSKTLFMILYFFFCIIVIVC